MTYPAIVIGAGRIAQGFDTVTGDTVLTHVKGYLRHPAFQPVGICDTDPGQAETAAARWGIATAAAEPAALFALSPAVVSICTPDATHAALLRQCLAAGARLVFCEKPLSLDVREAEAIVADYRARGALLAVNYSRRWLPELMAYRERVRAGEFGRVVSARIKYYGGFFHNGSHLLDLLAAFLEPVLETGSVLPGGGADGPDRTISAACRLSSALGPFTLMIEGYQGGRMAPLELEIIFEEARLLVEELNGSWLTLARLKENETYPGFFEFSAKSRVRIAAETAMPNAIANLAAALNSGAPLASTGETALATLRLCQAIFSLANTP